MAKTTAHRPCVFFFIAALAVAVCSCPAPVFALDPVATGLIHDLDQSKSASSWTDNSDGSDLNSVSSSILLIEDPAVLQNIFSSYELDGNRPGTSGADFEGIRLNANNNGRSEPTGTAGWITTIGEGTNVDNNTATFELWFDPDDPNQQRAILWETGGGTGASFTYDQGVLSFRVIGGGGLSLTTVDLTSIDLPDGAGQDLVTGERFIQAVGVADIERLVDPGLAKDAAYLYINGTQVALGTQSGASANGHTSWDGGDGAAIGGQGGDNLGGYGGNVNFPGDGGSANGTFTSFDGGVSIFRTYGNNSGGASAGIALSSTQILQNHQAVNPDDIVFGNSGGNWNTPGDWTGGIAPTVDENAYIIGGVTANLASAQTANNVLVGGDTESGATTGDGILNITGGQLDIVNDLWIGAADSTGTVNQSNGTVVIGRDLDFAPAAGAAALTRGGLYRITGGSLVIGQSIYRRPSAAGMTQGDLDIQGGTVEFANGNVNARNLDNLDLAAGATLAFTVDDLVNGQTILSVEDTATFANGSQLAVNLQPDAGDTTAGSASTWNAGTDTWDAAPAKWSTTTYAPDGKGAFLVGQSIDLISATTLAGDTSNLVAAGSDTNWQFSVTGGSVIEAERINTAGDFSAVTAVITGAASQVTRNADLRIANAADGPDAAALRVEDDASLTLTGASNLVLGGGGQGDVDQGIVGSGANPVVTIGGNLLFGTGPNSEGGTYNLNAGTLTVAGDIREVDPTVANADLNLNGSTLDVGGVIVVEDFHIGNVAGSSSSFTIAAGKSVTTTQSFHAGSAGVGQVTNDGGTLIVGNGFVVGDQGTSDNNSFTQNGGATTVSAGATRIGNNADSTGNLFSLQGGEFRSQGGFFVADGATTSGGTVLIGGSGNNPTIVTSGGNFEVATVGTGEVVLEDGSIVLNSNNFIPNQGTGSNGVFTQNGGVVDLRGENGAGTDRDINFNNGNATLNLNSGAFYVARDVQMLSRTANGARTATLNIAGGTLLIRDDLVTRTNGSGTGTKTDIINLTGGELIFGNESGQFAGGNPANDLNFQASAASANQFNWTGGLLEGVDNIIGVANLPGAEFVQRGGEFGVLGGLGSTSIDGSYRVEDGATIAALFDASAPAAAITVAPAGTVSFDTDATTTGTYGVDIELTAAPDTGAGMAATFDGDVSTNWDATAANWTGDRLPAAAATVVGTGTQFTVIDSANALAGTPLNATINSGWSLGTSGDGTDLTVTATADMGAGAVRAIIDGTSTVERDTNLRINTALDLEQTDAAALQIDDTATLNINGGSELVLGGGNNTGGEGTVDQNGGTVNVSGNLRFGPADAVGAQGGTYNLNGGALNVTGDIIETNSAIDTAQLHIDGGALTVGGNNITVQSLRIGNAAGSMGSHTFDNKTVTNTGALYVGFEGTGRLDVTGNTSIAAPGSFIVAGGTGGNGTVNFGSATDAPTLTTSAIEVGDIGDATMNIVNGSVTATGGFRIADNEAGSTGALTIGNGATSPVLNVSGGNFETANTGTGTVIMHSGTFNQTSNNLIVGQGAQSNAAFTLNGGEIDLQNQLRIGNQGTGVFNQNGGVVRVGSQLDFANNAAGDSIAIYNMTGGELRVGDRVNEQIIIGNENNANSLSTFNITGGIVSATFGLRIADNGSGSSGALVVGTPAIFSPPSGGESEGPESIAPAPLLRINTSQTNNNTNGNFETADNGTGTFTLHNGDVFLESANMIVGQATTSDSTVVVNGGGLHIGYEVLDETTRTSQVTGGAPDSDINFNNGIGRFTQNGGLVRVSRSLNGHANTGAGQFGELTVNGGLFQVGSSLDYRDGAMTVTASGGTLEIGSNLTMNNGTAALNISGGGTVKVGNNLNIGSATVTTATVTQTGGVLLVDGIFNTSFVEDGGGTANGYVFSGGRLSRASDGDLTITGDLVITADAIVGFSGGVEDKGAGLVDLGGIGVAVSQGFRSIDAAPVPPAFSPGEDDPEGITGPDFSGGGIFDLGGYNLPTPNGVSIQTGFLWVMTVNGSDGSMGGDNIADPNSAFLDNISLTGLDNASGATRLTESDFEQNLGSFDTVNNSFFALVNGDRNTAANTGVDIGIRWSVAQIPEPGSALLLVLGAAPFLRRRRD